MICCESERKGINYWKNRDVDFFFFFFHYLFKLICLIFFFLLHFSSSLTFQQSPLMFAIIDCLS